MTYEISLGKAWDELETLAPKSEYVVDFLADHYSVRIGEKAALLQPSGIVADEVSAVLILHYIIGNLKCGFHSRGEWISFKELRAGNVFGPAFQKSTIEPLAANFEQDPDGLVKRLERSSHSLRIQSGDVGFEVAVFPGIFVRVIFWKNDEDLPGDAAMLFDRGLADIYSTEDIAVLLMRVAEWIKQ